MDSRIKELVDLTSTKLGLQNYYLKRHQFDRRITIFNDTVYTLSLEWFPNHETVDEDDGLNPKGTACVEINLESGKFESVIFVMGKTYAEGGVAFATHNTDDIIKWIEAETGLAYGKQFQLQKEERGEFLFKECVDGVAVYPAGYIEMKFDDEGKLTVFSMHGQFPSQEWIREEKYSLSLVHLERLKKEQVKLIEFPSYEQKKIVPAYAVEEIFVSNDGLSTFPFHFFADTKSYLRVEESIEWDEPLHQPFERKEINWIEDITAEQAFSCEPSPDLTPISLGEQEVCVRAVRNFLRQEYPNDSGKWILKTLHRDKGYIHATLKTNQTDNRVFKRKIKIMIDAKNFQAVNYLDNQPMLDVLDQFQTHEMVTITKNEAYEKMNQLFELKPYYVYDIEQKQYILCGKLDCRYGVKASNGEVVALDDL